MERPTLAGILRTGAAYRRTHALSPAQAHAWRAIVECRTAALGGVRERCDACGAERHVWRSCRNRHCPQCQTRAKEAWRGARLRELLPVPYAHWVFTLPHELNSLGARHPRWLFDTLFGCAAATLLELAANPRWLGATPAFSLVLHTWTQDLRTHPHVHALITVAGSMRRGSGKPRAVAAASSFRYRRPRAYSVASFSTHSKRPGAPASFRMIPKRAPPRGKSATARCSPMTGWSMPNPRRAVRPRYSTTSHAIPIGSQSRTNAFSPEITSRCGFARATTETVASARSCCSSTPSSGDFCSMCCRAASNASVTTACWPHIISGLG